MKQSSLKIMKSFISRYQALECMESALLKCIELLHEAYLHENKLLVCGNGGSAADSLHIVGELMKSFKLKRPMDSYTMERLKELYPDDSKNFMDIIEGALPAHSLVSETGLITAFSNDKNASYVFAQQVYGLGKPGDVLLAISTSGNSENVVLACKMAKAKNMKVISLTGSSGGKIKPLSDININVPSDGVYIIQEYHLPIYHLICLVLENEFWGEHL